MKKFIIASLIGAFFPLAISCERQNWDETRMFHDVPGKKHPKGDKSHDGKAAGHKPEKEKAGE